MKTVKEFLKKFTLFVYINKALKLVKNRGILFLFKAIIRKILKQPINESELFKHMFITEVQRSQQKKKVFEYSPLISILVPLYNTPKEYLLEMLESVKKQTYANWELIIADASDEPLENTIISFNEHRFKYIRLSNNDGIVGNTNTAFRYAHGEFIGLLDHDDVLAENCLFEVVNCLNNNTADIIYTDEITFKDKIFNAYQPNLKPDYSLDTLRSYNYICHFTCFRKTLLFKDEVPFRSEAEGSQDYDLILRLVDRSEKVSHIPKVLYFWRAHEHSTAQTVAAKPYTMDAAKFALNEHLHRRGLSGTVTDARIPTTYKIDYELNNNLKVSILIPNKDHLVDLKKCIDSIINKSTYNNYEIIIIENNSEENETFIYYEKLKEKYSFINVITYNSEFNYSAINNFGVSYAKGELLLFLNNDIEVITPNWIEELLMFAQREDVGCVGAKLLYPDDTIQHAGVIIGIGGVAGHSHKYFHKDDYGFMSRIQIVQNLSAVTAACLMVKKKDFFEVNGFDENLRVAFNDVDFCLRIKEYLHKNNVYSPYAELYHYESKSRGVEDTEEKVRRFNSEVAYFEERWAEFLKKGDPCYNKNLTLKKENFEIL